VLASHGEQRPVSGYTLEVSLADLGELEAGANHQRWNSVGYEHLSWLRAALVSDDIPQLLPYDDSYTRVTNRGETGR
jgi:hypothetical protein